MEAHCVNLELKHQNQALKEGQHGQFSKVKNNEAKVKYDIDEIDTINIELEHKVAKLLKENESLKKHYKELSDSIKTTRAKTIEHTTSLIAQNVKFKAQLQEKGEPVLQPQRNHSVVRQPNAFKSKRPKISKPQFTSQVDVNNDLSKPVTTQYLPKERKSAVVKPRHVFASSESRNSSKNMPRFSSNDMVYNHYLEEARKKTQQKGRNSEPSVMPSARSQSITNVGLRWVPTGKIFTSSTTKVNSEPPNGSNKDIYNPYECKQTLDVSAEMTSNHNSSELGIQDHNNEPSSSTLVPKVVPPAVPSQPPKDR
ncbi:hypothetical protein Tco_0345452 [Tanacetum coccineum]